MGIWMIFEYIMKVGKAWKGVSSPTIVAGSFWGWGFEATAVWSVRKIFSI
jgi:hypothetical protein